MKKILSLSKMRETLPLPSSKSGKKLKATFMKDKITELSDSDFDFLKGKKNGPFSFLLNEGTFKLVSETKEDEPEKKPLSRKEKAKLEKAEKAKAKKLAEEKKTERQGK